MEFLFFPSKMAAVKKVGQKNGEVQLLVEYLFCGLIDLDFHYVISRHYVFFTSHCHYCYFYQLSHILRSDMSLTNIRKGRLKNNLCMQMSFYAG